MAVTQVEDNEKEELPPDRLIPSEIQDFRKLREPVLKWIKKAEFYQELRLLLKSTWMWVAWAVGGAWVFFEGLPRFFEVLPKIASTLGRLLK